MNRFWSPSGRASRAAPSGAPSPVGPNSSQAAGLSGAELEASFARHGARAIQLIGYDSMGKFYMDPQAVAMLRKLKGPLAVVSVCGRSRQGKSFILNQLLGKSSGFQVGPTHKPCTKGIWIWSSPIERTALDGTPYHVLLLDTEGIEAYDQTNTYSTQIFTLAVLLSSFFVFNQMGGIDESSLDQLALVTHLTQHIRVKSQQNTRGIPTSTKELSQHSPYFLWLLRDFYFDLTEDGRRLTPRDYLEEALKTVVSNSPVVQGKNKIRESIRGLFPNRDCFTLFRPLMDETQLQRLDRLPMSELRPEFRDGIKGLTDLIFEKALPKRMGNSVLTGPIFASLTQTYLDAINGGAIPTIASSWQTVEEKQCREAMELALLEYSKAFDKSVTPDDDSLLAAHKAAMDRALLLFEEGAMGIGSTRDSFHTKLLESLESKYKERRERMCIEAELRCKEILAGYATSLHMTAARKDASVTTLLQALSGLINDYKKLAVGPGKWTSLAEFVQSTLQQVLSPLATKVQENVRRLEGELEESRKSENLWQSKAQSATDRLSDRDEKLTQAIRQLREVQGQLAVAEGAMSHHNADWQAKLDRSLLDSRSKDAELERLRSVEQSYKEKLESQSVALRATETRLVEMTGRKTSQSAALSRLEKEKGELEARLQKEREEKVTAESWKRRYNEAMEAARKSREEALAENLEERKALQGQRDALLRKKDADLEELRSQYGMKVKELSRVTLKLEECEAKIVTFNQTIADAQQQIRALREAEDCMTHSTSSVRAELQSARDMLSVTQRELQGAMQAVRQAEHARANSDLEVRKEAELRQQADLRVSQLERALNEHMGSASDLALLKAQHATLQADLQEALSAKAQMASLLEQAEREKEGGERGEASVKEERASERKRRRTDSGFASTVEGGHEADSDNTTGGTTEKLTKVDLRKAISSLGYGDKLLEMKNPNRGELLALYKKVLEGHGR